MEAYIENRSTLEALLSKMQIDFECLRNEIFNGSYGDGLSKTI